MDTINEDFENVLRDTVCHDPEMYIQMLKNTNDYKISDHNDADINIPEDVVTAYAPDGSIAEMMNID